jgi:hypothetical protein
VIDSIIVTKIMHNLVHDVAAQARYTTKVDSNTMSLEMLEYGINSNTGRHPSFFVGRDMNCQWNDSATMIHEV